MGPPLSYQVFANLCARSGASGRWRVRDQTDHIQAGARRVCKYFAKRPHNLLDLTDQAQKLLLGALH